VTGRAFGADWRMTITARPWWQEDVCR
jgi:hypothetical protein